MGMPLSGGDLHATATSEWRTSTGTRSGCRVATSTFGGHNWGGRQGRVKVGALVPTINRVAHLAHLTSYLCPLLHGTRSKSLAFMGAVIIGVGEGPFPSLGSREGKQWQPKFGK